MFVRVAVFLGVVLMAAVSSAAEGRVELEVAMDRGFPPSESHGWAKLLAEVGFERVQIRAARATDKVELVKRGTEAAPVYHVTGTLTARGTLRVPGATFSANDARRIKEWLEKLSSQGPPTEGDEKTVFGLTAKQFSTLNQDLARQVSIATKDQRIDDVVNKLASGLAHTLVIDAAAATALAGGEIVYDDLRGLSHGTAIAAALRPAGLVLVPRVSGGRVELLVTSGRGAKQLWPIGWESDKADGKLVPALAEQVNAEIEETPLGEVMETIAERLKTKVLYDHNALAQLDVDLDKTTVKLAPARLGYASVVRKLLYPARLKFEVRVDEAGKPFLWVSGQ